jgi:hypothetical protein
MVFETPENQTGTKCGVEWEKHGTCCNITLLTAHANSIEDKARKSVNSTLLTVQNIHTNILTLLNKKNEFVWNNKQRANNHKFVKYLNENWEKMQLDLFRVIQDKKFEASLHQCAQKFVKVIQNSLCYVCSGRSEQFFTKGSNRRAVVTHEACEYYLEDCTVGFNRALQIIQEFEPVISSINIDDIDWITEKDKKCLNGSKKTFASFFEKIRVLHIVENFQSLQTARDEQIHSMRYKLCGSVMTLSKNTFLQRIEKELKSVLRHLTALTKKLQGTFSSFSQNATVLDSKKTNFRMLLDFSKFKSDREPLNTQLISPFSDVVVFSPKKVDSSYTSYYGSIGTCGNEANLLFRPIPFNVTQKFP